MLGFTGVRGVDQGPFFRFKNGNLLTKTACKQHIWAALQAIRLPESQFASHSFRIGAATTAAGYRGFYHLNAWKMEKHSLPTVYLYSKTAVHRLHKMYISLSTEIENNHADKLRY